MIQSNRWTSWEAPNIAQRGSKGKSPYGLSPAWERNPSHESPQLPVVRKPALGYTHAHGKHNGPTP